MPRKKGVAQFSRDEGRKNQIGQPLFAKYTSVNHKIIIDLAGEADAPSPWWLNKLVRSSKPARTEDVQKALAQGDLQDILKIASKSNEYVRINLLDEFM